ncbi:hypothetical protein JW962_02280 [Candidatus Dojkabacteria bacterium]|nr:hypothetical protein [Candidatus Dojkabacteria bacterium]
MSKIEKLFTKGMRILTMALLFMVVIGTISGSFKVSAGDPNLSAYTECSEVTNQVYGTEGTSAADYHCVNTMAGILVFGQRLIGLGVFPVEDQMALLQESEAARSMGYGLLDRSSEFVTYAFSNFPTSVNPGVYIAQEWSPSRINQANAATAPTSGQDMLKPIKDLWDYTKNIAYVGFVVVVVVIGFMIMFRQKINGQVAVSITNSIPRVIIGMILVHASFFLAGLLLSVSTFVMALISNLIADYYTKNGISMQPIGLGGPWYFWTNTQWILTGAVDMTGGVGNAAHSASIKQTLQGAVTSWGNALITTFKGWGTSAGDLLASTASVSMSAVTAATGFIYNGGITWKDILVKIIISVGLIYASFKIVFNLFLAYAQIFMKVIALPIVTLIGTLPGQEKMIIDSYKGIFADALVFPVTFAMINIGAVVAISSIKTAITFPGGINTTLVDPGAGNIGGLIAYAIVLAAASADKFTKEFLKVQGSQAAGLATKSIVGMSSKTPLIGGLLKSVGE